MKPLFYEFGETDESKMVGNERMDYYFTQRLKGMTYEQGVRLIEEDYIALLSWSKHPDVKSLLVSSDSDEVKFGAGIYTTEGAIFGMLLYQGLDAYVSDILAR